MSICDDDYNKCCINKKTILSDHKPVELKNADFSGTTLSIMTFNVGGSTSEEDLKERCLTFLPGSRGRSISFTKVNQIYGDDIFTLFAIYDIICLQEVSQDLFAALSSSAIIREHFNFDSHQQCRVNSKCVYLFILYKKKITKVEHSFIDTPINSEKRYLPLCLSYGGKTFWVINCKYPMNKLNIPGVSRQEKQTYIDKVNFLIQMLYNFINSIFQTQEKDTNFVIIAGDLNFRYITLNPTLLNPILFLSYKYYHNLLQSETDYIISMKFTDIADIYKDYTHIIKLFENIGGLSFNALQRENLKDLSPESIKDKIYQRKQSDIFFEKKRLLEQIKENERLERIKESIQIEEERRINEEERIRIEARHQEIEQKRIAEEEQTKVSLCEPVSCDICADCDFNLDKIKKILSNTPKIKTLAEVFPNIFTGQFKPIDISMVITVIHNFLKQKKPPTKIPPDQFFPTEISPNHFFYIYDGFSVLEINDTLVFSNNEGRYIVEEYSKIMKAIPYIFLVQTVNQKIKEEKEVKVRKYLRMKMKYITFKKKLSII
jgi:hypothetical protein